MNNENESKIPDDWKLIIDMPGDFAIWDTSLGEAEPIKFVPYSDSPIRIIEKPEHETVHFMFKDGRALTFELWDNKIKLYSEHPIVVGPNLDNSYWISLEGDANGETEATSEEGGGRP